MSLRSPVLILSPKYEAVSHGFCPWVCFGLSIPKWRPSHITEILTLTVPGQWTILLISKHWQAPYLHTCHFVDCIQVDKCICRTHPSFDRCLVHIFQVLEDIHWHLPRKGKQKEEVPTDVISTKQLKFKEMGIISKKYKKTKVHKTLPCVKMNDVIKTSSTTFQMCAI